MFTSTPTLYDHAHVLGHAVVKCTETDRDTYT